MGIMDKANEMKDKAKDAVGTDENVDKMAEKAKGATGNKHDEQIDQASEKAKEMKDKM